MIRDIIYLVIGSSHGRMAQLVEHPVQFNQPFPGGQTQGRMAQLVVHSVRIT